METLLKKLILLLSSLALIAACGSNSGNKRQSNGGKDGGNTGKKDTDKDVVDGEDEGEEEEEEGDTTQTDESSLPPYLFTLADAKAVDKLVLTLQKSSGDRDVESDPSQSKLKSLIQQFLDDTMEMDVHAPGRNFVVAVKDSEEPNASALNESVVVHSSMTKVANTISLAVVLCHEIAHSTRNHNYLYEKEFERHSEDNKEIADKLDKEINTFIEDNYDPEKEEFTLTASAVAKIQPTWDEFWDGLTVFNKRQESEADIVGGQICANAGFTQSEVKEGYVDLFAAFEKLEEGSDGGEIDDGVYEVKEDELIDFLQAVLGSDTHPSNRERAAQVKRLVEVFKKSDVSETIAANWKSDYDDASGGSGLLLAGEDHTGHELGDSTTPCGHDHSGDLQHQYLSRVLGRR